MKKIILSLIFIATASSAHAVEFWKLTPVNGIIQATVYDTVLLSPTTGTKYVNIRGTGTIEAIDVRATKFYGDISGCTGIPEAPPTPDQVSRDSITVIYTYIYDLQTNGGIDQVSRGSITVMTSDINILKSTASAIFQQLYQQSLLNAIFSTWMSSFSYSQNNTNIKVMQDTTTIYNVFESSITNIYYNFYLQSLTNAVVQSTGTDLYNHVYVLELFKSTFSASQYSFNNATNISTGSLQSQANAFATWQSTFSASQSNTNAKVTQDTTTAQANINTIWLSTPSFGTASAGNAVNPSTQNYNMGGYSIQNVSSITVNQVNGSSMTLTGNCTAQTFYGDGSHLTGISSSGGGLTTFYMTLGTGQQDVYASSVTFNPFDCIVTGDTLTITGIDFFNVMPSTVTHTDYNIAYSSVDIKPSAPPFTYLFSPEVNIPKNTMHSNWQIPTTITIPPFASLSLHCVYVSSTGGLPQGGGALIRYTRHVP